jgi:hypothetical protein
VAQDHQVDVHVHEAGQHAHAGGVDHGGAGRDGHLGPRAHRHDAIARDQHHAVVDRRAFVAVDDLAAHQGEGGPGLGEKAGRNGQHGDGEGQHRGKGQELFTHARTLTRLSRRPEDG